MAVALRIDKLSAWDCGVAGGTVGADAADTIASCCAFQAAQWPLHFVRSSSCALQVRGAICEGSESVIDKVIAG